MNRQRSKKVTKICLECKREFHPFHVNAKHEQKWCSQKCCGKSKKVSRDHKREVRKKWEARNKAIMLEKAREYRRSHPEKIVQYELKNSQKKIMDCYNPSTRLRCLARNAITRVRNTAIPYELELKDHLYKNPPTHCKCCGEELFFGRGLNNPRAPSLDRLIPADGYTIKNVRVICIRCNLVKSNATPEELDMAAAYARREIAANRRAMNHNPWCSTLQPSNIPLECDCKKVESTEIVVDSKGGISGTPEAIEQLNRFVEARPHIL